MSKKSKKSYKVKGTIRQRDAMKKLLEKRGKKRSVGKAMREAGYSDKSADNPKILTESKGFKSFLAQLKTKRQKSIEALTQKKIDKADYAKLVDGIDKMTKMVELLEGRETGRNKVIITDL